MAGPLALNVLNISLSPSSKHPGQGCGFPVLTNPVDTAAGCLLPFLPAAPVFQSTHSSLAEGPPGHSQHWDQAEDSPQGSGRPGVPALPEALITLCAATWEMGTTPDPQQGYVQTLSTKYEVCMAQAP